MYRRRLVWRFVVIAALAAQVAICQEAALPSKSIPAGAKVFIAPVDNGFENFLAAAIQKKGVAVRVVTNREKADYEITSVAESEKAGWAKMLFTGSAASKEQAGIKMVDLKTDEVVFAYAVHKSNSARGRQSAAEACAKHLKEKMEGR